MLLRIFAVCLLFTSAVSCTVAKQVGCSVETAVESTVVVSIASALECANQEAIKATLDPIVAKANLCQSAQALAIGKKKVSADGKPALKSIGGDVCQGVADGLVSSLAGSAIPAAWGCTAGAATDSVKGLVDAACQKAFP